MSELPELIQALLDPQIYPERPPAVELLQTQISYVLLAGEYVYKIKKPVDFGFLDYSTLEKRQYFCQKEIELNRRLCPGAYLGVVPVTRDGGDFTVNGKGKIVEYAVRMRRLPEEAMMNVLLENNSVSPEMVNRVASLLVEFHQRTETNTTIGAFGNLDIITKTTLEENFGLTEKYAGSIISQEKYQHLKDYTGNYLKTNAPLFHKRVIDGKIRDCHGDLHAGHICFNNGICIFDCIEFIDRLRYTDVTAEVAFLAMDLDHYGRTDLSDSFVATYVEKSGDLELMHLLNFYKCYRAYVRCKVGCLQYDDPYIPDAEKEKILVKTRGYLELAESYTGH
jgi:aminoglycoside phosphotransferase family enzyme